MTLAREEKLEVMSKERCVQPTQNAADKLAASGVAGGPESLFSAAMLPELFFRDFLRGHSAKALQLGLRILLTTVHVHFILNNS